MSTRGRGIDFDASDAALRVLGVSRAQLAGVAGVAAARSLLDRLDPAQIIALKVLVDLGGVAPVLLAVDEIAEELGGGPGNANSSAEARRSAEHALLALWETGVVARDRASRTFFLVPDLGAALVPPLRERLLRSLTAAQPPQPAIDDHLLACAISVLRHEPLKLTREDLPFKRSLETLADRLKAELPRKDPLARVDMLVATLLDLDMLHRRGDTLEIQIAAAYEWAHAGRERR